jgi:hypothetical protein
MDQVNQTLNEINDSVRRISQWEISAMLSSIVGQLASWGSVFASLGTVLTGYGISTIPLYESLKSFFPKKEGKIAATAIRKEDIKKPDEAMQKMQIPVNAYSNNRINPITPTAINNVRTAVALNDAGTQPGKTEVQGFDGLNAEASTQTRIQQDLLSVMIDVKNLLMPSTTTEQTTTIADTSARTKSSRPPLNARVPTGNYFSGSQTNRVY